MTVFTVNGHQKFRSDKVYKSGYFSRVIYKNDPEYKNEALAAKWEKKI